MSHWKSREALLKGQYDSLGWIKPRMYVQCRYQNQREVKLSEVKLRQFYKLGLCFNSTCNLYREIFQHLIFYRNISNIISYILLQNRRAARRQCVLSYLIREQNSLKVIYKVLWQINNFLHYQFLLYSKSMSKVQITLEMHLTWTHSYKTVFTAGMYRSCILITSFILITSHILHNQYYPSIM